MGNKIWYCEAANSWEEALPIGNGRLGAMISGDPVRETVWLNEDSIWSGRKLDRINPDAEVYLQEIRRLLREGKIPEAERLSLYALSGAPNSQRAYETAGELYMNFRYESEISNYRRELDMDEGCVRTLYQVGTTVYQQEWFASAVAQTLALHLTAQGEGSLNFDCVLGRCHNRTDQSGSFGGDSIYFLVDGGQGISFVVRVLVKTKGGNVRTIGEHVIVEKAKEAVLLLDIETSFRQKDYCKTVESRLQNAADKGWEGLRREHVAEYGELFRRVQISLAERPKEEKRDTRALLRAVQNGGDENDLLEQYFQYGRYLLLSSSRGDCLPANLQGIWNKSLTPSWDSKYTININTQMNYWLAESGSLPECHLPYFRHLRKVMESGRETACRMYGCRGSVAHHNTDIYADTVPQDQYIPATFWVMGEAWLATHIWEHYRYTGDKAFLEGYLDVVEECIRFFDDFLTQREDGTLVTSPSVSPENTYILPDGTRGCLCEGAAMDTEILRELLYGYLQAAGEVKRDPEFAERAEEIRNRLPEMKIGKYGQIQEWLEDYEEAEPGHRHISQLYALYPGTQWNWRDTPEWMEAARATLRRRLAHGGGHTGWSRAWIIGLWARLGDGEEAYENLRALLAQSTFPNLMDNHPMGQGAVFQIDGNLGAAAAFIEMLVQSHEGRIVLLPAIPEQIGTGEVSGLSLRGQIRLTMAWKKKRIVRFSLLSSTDQEVTLVFNEREEKIVLQAGKEYHYQETVKA